MGTENLGNGSGKSDRFPGKYRGARRDGAALEEVATGEERGGRDGAVVGLAAVPSPARAVLDLDAATTDLGDAALDLGGASVNLGVSALDLGAVARPGYPSGDRLASTGSPLVEHPLLRGLLLELPPRSAAPEPAWLDRWFEATRAILELLYARGDVRR